MSTIKIFRSCMMTGFLVVLLLMAGRFFLTGYKRYALSQDKKSELTRRIKLLNQQQSDREHKLHSISRMNRFLNNAELLGLEQSRWTAYNVDIQDSVTFTEMKKMLLQCSNADSHYFRPVSFHIKSLKATKNNGGTFNNKTSETIFENETGDILMTLKGAFVVRN